MALLGYSIFKQLASGDDPLSMRLHEILVFQNLSVHTHMAHSPLIPVHIHSAFTLVTPSCKLFSSTGSTKDLQHKHFKVYESLVTLCLWLAVEHSERKLLLGPGRLAF